MAPVGNVMQIHFKFNSSPPKKNCSQEIMCPLHDTSFPCSNSSAHREHTGLWLFRNLTFSTVITHYCALTWNYSTYSYAQKIQDFKMGKVLKKWFLQHVYLPSRLLDHQMPSTLLLHINMNVPCVLFTNTDSNTSHYEVHVSCSCFRTFRYLISYRQYSHVNYIYLYHFDTKERATTLPVSVSLIQLQRWYAV